MSLLGHRLAIRSRVCLAHALGRTCVSIRCSPQDSAGGGAQAAMASIAGFWLAFQFHGRSSAICLAG
jgi:hypothetical protein